MSEIKQRYTRWKSNNAAQNDEQLTPHSNEEIQKKIKSISIWKDGDGVISGQNLTQNHPLKEDNGREKEN